MTTPIPFTRGLLVCAIPLALAACATTEPAPSADAPARIPVKNAAALSPALAEVAARANDPNAQSAADRAKIYKGSGVMVKGQEPGGGVAATAPVQVVGGGAVVLNFEAADLRDVIRN